MILQLDPPIPLQTPKGPSECHFLIDYSPEYDLLWVCFLDSNGECWTFPNKEVRAIENFSIGRRFKKHTKKMPEKK